MEKTVEKIAWYSFLTLIIVVIIGVSLFIKSDVKQKLGSVGVTSEYNATTTKDSTAFAPQVLKASAGTLGSVITTITGTGTLTLYDATTTNVNLRTNNTATSALPILAYFGVSPTVGTYTFDEIFNRGLIAVWGTGTVSSSTITWR